ncbi:hypothetical protein JCM3770_007299 [Rhodotorula araucariae]
MAHSPSTASLSSLVTALSEADATAQSARLLFSPTSARTSGTGATGSTEPPGAATLSLIASADERDVSDVARTNPRVDGQGREDLCRALLGSPGSRSHASGETTWTRVSGREALREETAAAHPQVQLPTPEPEDPVRPPTGVEKVSAPGSIDEHPTFIKAESDDGLLAHALLARPDMPSVSRSYSNPEAESPPPDTLTDSQEGALLAQSVTRSQSDFSHWLEETLRLARGDGSSTIESDDALSSIIEATRHAQLGWPRAPRPPPTEDGESNDGMDPLPEEEWTLSTVRTRETDVVINAEATDETGVDVQLNEEADSAPATPATASNGLVSPRAWKVISFALAAALACSLRQQALLSAAVNLQPEPTRALYYVPLNETARVSQFATPIPVGSALPLPVYALFFTLVAGISASVPLLRRRRARFASRPSCSAHARSLPAASTPLTRTRALSPLLELNGDALLEARALLSLGIEQYTAGLLSAASATFGAVVALPCAPADKALASEWRGRALYRLARADGDDRARLDDAAGAFDRAIRLDSGRATPRASLGRVEYRRGEFQGAVTALRAALKRDDELAFAHEYLAKALARLDPSPADAAQLIEAHLVRAVELDPQAYTALAFLGEFLHISGGASRLATARGYLERAVALRADYPAAHARLAFIANEALDAPCAARHYAAVVRTRHTGLRDPGALSASERACDGTAPFLSWAFVTPRRSPARCAVLTHAAQEHPHDDLVALLLAIEASSPAYGQQPGAGASAALVEREAALARRCERFTPSEDPLAHGLWALALGALGHAEAAESVYARFWEAVAARPRTGNDDRAIAFLAMAFYEIKGAEAASARASKTPSRARDALWPTPVRRRVTRAVKREEDRALAADVLAAEGKTVTPLRRSPRKHAVAGKA